MRDMYALLYMNVDNMFTCTYKIYLIMHISGLSFYSERVYKTPSFNEKDRQENIGF